MISHVTAALLAAALFVEAGVGPAFAENKMGYSLLPASEAAQLPRGGGSLGMDVGRAQQITDSGMTFDLLKVNSVRRSSAADKAGFRAGDEIIAVDGRVFPSVGAFAAYVGSGAPGRQISVDYIPAGGGPQEAQRISLALGAGNQTTLPQSNTPPETRGLSTGTKVAIGIGAAALFGCYKLGCLSRFRKGSSTSGQQLQRQ